MFEMRSLLRQLITVMANGGCHPFTVWTLSDDLLMVNKAECIVGLIENTVFVRIRQVTSDKGAQSALEGILQTLQEDDKVLYFAAFVFDPIKIL